MRARIDNQVLFVHADDVPAYKKTGSMVRNNYFWALRAIAGQANMGKEWEFESEVWIALQRMLLSFTESGYLGLSETMLEFSSEQGAIPNALRAVSTFR